jgi:hypothetical protein
MSDLHTQPWNLLRDGVTLALEGLYDYTDMIYAPVAANLSPAQRFELECVDEAQDLSPIQLSFILRLPHPGGRLLFVSTPDRPSTALPELICARKTGSRNIPRLPCFLFWSATGTLENMDGWPGSARL